MSDRSDDLFGFDEESAPAAQAAPEGAENEEVENKTSVTKCPACGANMVYDSESGKLYCEHCGTTTDIDSKSAEEQDFERLMREDNSWGAETHVFRCENCGAREVLGKGEIVKTCPFCGTSNIVATDELSGLKPNAVVPFRVGKEQAGESVRKWARGRWLSPGKFRKSAKPDKLAGIYVPAFSFDSHTESNYVATLGRYYYVTRRVNGRTVRDRRIRYFTVRGHYSMGFDDVLVSASDKIDGKSMSGLRSFDTNASREYTQEYLSGYSASQYTRDGLTCWEDAKNIMRGRVRAAVLSGYSYDVVSSFNLSMRCSDITYKYLLIPIYVGHCSWRKKLYNFFVNGVNGAVTGKAPTSPLKVTGLVVLGIAVIVGLYFLFRWFNG